MRAVVQANVELGQAQLLALGAVADSLLATAGQMSAAGRRPMFDAGEGLGCARPMGLAGLQGRVRRGDPRRPWFVGGPSGAEDVEHAFVSETETKASYLYSVELPGVVEGDLLVEVVDASIMIEASRPARGAEPSVRYETSIWVPEDGDLETVTAELVHGVLHVELTRREQIRGRQVKVEARSGSAEEEPRPESGTKS